MFTGTCTLERNRSVDHPMCSGIHLCKVLFEKDEAACEVMSVSIGGDCDGTYSGNSRHRRVYDSPHFSPRAIARPETQLTRE
jgi:hypothetical protein